MRLLLAVVLSVLLAWPASAEDAPRQQDLWVSGKDGYHTYRIPALIQSPRKTLLAFCEGRKKGSGDHGDVDLLMKRSVDGGRTWSAQTVVHEEGGDAKTTIGNPCVVADAKTGTLWMAMTRDNRAVLITSSKDDGETWSAPQDISAQVMRPEWSWVATGPGIGIQLTQGKHAGRLVIPCDHKVRLPDRVLDCRSHVMFSDDGGVTWSISDPITAGGNECQVVELADGTLLLNTRMQAHYEGFRGISRSSDGGQTWSVLARDEELPCPQCQASLIAIPGKSGHSRLAFSNPALNPELSGKKTKASRRKLTIRFSDDAGESWGIAEVLHEGPSAYSSLAMADARTILCLYEAGERSPMAVLRLARIPHPPMAEK